MLSVLFLLVNLAAVGRHGREQAKQTLCLSNVAQLAQAWLKYKDDNDGRLVPPYDLHTHIGILPWVTSLADSRHSLELKKQEIREGALFPYVGSIDTYHCPSDIRLTDSKHRLAFLSYSIPQGANGLGLGWIERTVIVAETYSELRAPADSYILLEETPIWDAWVMEFDPLRWVDSVAMWHGKKTTLGFADGHVELHPWQNQSTIDWSYTAMYDPENFKFVMSPPADEQEDIVYMAGHFPLKTRK